MLMGWEIVLPREFSSKGLKSRYKADILYINKPISLPIEIFTLQKLIQVI